MTTHAERRNLPYSQEQLFEIVADVEKYPEFLPWCIRCDMKTSTSSPQPSTSSPRRRGSGAFKQGDSRLHGNDDMVEIFYADLTIGYKMIREKFGSKVTLSNKNHIHVEYISGPMKYLSNHWKFIAEDDGTCTIDFYVEFEFKNRVLQNIMGAFFNEIVRRMVGAFERRAKELYGQN